MFAQGDLWAVQAEIQQRYEILEGPSGRPEAARRVPAMLAVITRLRRASAQAPDGAVDHATASHLIRTPIPA